jgi:uncharacterized protein (TIGR00730 family)
MAEPTTQKLIIHNTDIRKICKGLLPDDYTAQMLCIVEDELREGFEMVKRHSHLVTVFGSARTEPSGKYYEEARALGKRLVQEFGVSVATGGGPGIMEGANRGAKEAGGSSVGMGIALPREQGFNQYVDEGVNFQFFFTRKVIMTYTADAFVIFPGGFGTLNELFELLALEQNHKAQPAPVILFGREFWETLNVNIISILDKRQFIDKNDIGLFSIVDSVDEAVEILHRFNVGKAHQHHE